MSDKDDVLVQLLEHGIDNGNAIRTHLNRFALVRDKLIERGNDFDESIFILYVTAPPELREMIKEKVALYLDSVVQLYECVLDIANATQACSDLQIKIIKLAQEQNDGQ